MISRSLVDVGGKGPGLLLTLSKSLWRLNENKSDARPGQGGGVGGLLQTACNKFKRLARPSATDFVTLHWLAEALPSSYRLVDSLEQVTPGPSTVGCRRGAWRLVLIRPALSSQGQVLSFQAKLFDAAMATPCHAVISMKCGMRCARCHLKDNQPPKSE